MEVTLGDFTPTGECTAAWGGASATVFGGIPGERVVAEVVRRRRDAIAARVVEALEPSPHRVESDCEYFWPCTGCQWRHIAYEQQLEIKRERVEAALRAAPGLEQTAVLPTMPSRSTSGYRNHARFTVGPGGTLGYVNHTTRRFLRVDRCDLMHPWINDALAHLQERSAETTQLSVRYGVNTGDYLVQPRLVGPGITLESGQKHYTEAMLGQAFRVASPSFFQVNTPTAEAMVELVGEQLRLAPTDLLIDAYAGVGVFARLLADRCRRVIAIEESSAAVKDARVNAEDAPTVEFRLGKTEDVLGTMEEAPDALILDPPRAGCDRRALDAVLRLGPGRVAYVSCEPDALARDLAVLVAGGYQVEVVQPVDLFPHTHHVECIAILSRDGGVSVPDLTCFDRLSTNGAGLSRDGGVSVPDLTLASASPRRRELLQLLGVEYSVTVSGVDETPGSGEDTPGQLAQALALRKARAVAAEQASGLVLGADTIVALDGVTYGKPADAREAEATLRTLRGKTHTVVTGVALVDAATGESAAAFDATRVTMRDYSDEEMAAYIATGNPMDKAGAYAAQDPAFHPAASINGCWTNVIGLPLCRVQSLLEQRGVIPPQARTWGPLGACAGCASIPEKGWPLPDVQHSSPSSVRPEPVEGSQERSCASIPEKGWPLPDVQHSSPSSVRPEPVEGSQERSCASIPEKGWPLPDVQPSSPSSVRPEPVEGSQERSGASILEKGWPLPDVQHSSPSSVRPEPVEGSQERSGASIPEKGWPLPDVQHSSPSSVRPEPVEGSQERSGARGPMS